MNISHHSYHNIFISCVTFDLQNYQNIVSDQCSSAMKPLCIYSVLPMSFSRNTRNIRLVLCWSLSLLLHILQNKTKIVLGLQNTTYFDILSSFNLSEIILALHLFSYANHSGFPQGTKWWHCSVTIMLLKSIL